MRVMIIFAIPIDAGNEGNRNRKLQKVFQKLAEGSEAEGPLFFPEPGQFPPVTSIVTPLTKSASLDARKQMTFA